MLLAGIISISSTDMLISTEEEDAGGYGQPLNHCVQKVQKAIVH